MGLLAAWGSESCRIYKKLKPSRGRRKKAFLRLSFSRRLQTVLSGIVCATRFKYYEGDEKLDTQCQNGKCGQVDSFEHLLQCSGIGEPPDIPVNMDCEEDEDECEELLEYLEKLAVKAGETHSGLPVPIRRCVEEELELFSVISRQEEGSEGEVSDLALEFENDENC